MEQKPIWASKTLWLQVLGIIAIVVPQSQAFIQEHLAASGVAWAFINMVLRIITKGKIEIL